MKRAILIAILMVIAFTCLMSTTFATTYEYDSLNRLVKVTYDDGTQIVYTYDKAGNRTAKKVVPGS